MSHWMVALVGACGLTGFTLAAQNLLPNPQFGEGAGTPRGWSLVNGSGRWQSPAPGNAAALEVNGTGDDQSAWQSERLGFKPAGLYRLQFRGHRVDGASGGAAVAGTTRVNRDFGLDQEWQDNSYIFSVPSDVTNDLVRLGQWHAHGRLAFARATLTPVQAVHASPGEGLRLGEGESVRAGVYRFQPNFGWKGANAHRPLVVNRAGFNSDRWLFSPGALLIYRFQVGAVLQQSAQVRMATVHHVAGELALEASRDGTTWTTVTNHAAGQRGGPVPLPATLFPAREIFLRLSSRGEQASLQMSAFSYEATLADPPPDAEGATEFLELLHDSPDRLAVRCADLREVDPESRWEFGLLVTNHSRTPLNLRGSAWLDADTPPAFIERESLTLTTDGRLNVRSPLGEPGTHFVNVLLEDDTGRALFAGRAEVRVGFLSDPRPGGWLMAGAGLGLWWCESGWKIGRDRGMPERPADGRPRPVRVSAARGEFEAAQVILRPERDGRLLGATVGPFRNGQGAAAAIDVQIDEVAYVPVTRPTDQSSLRGSYPDPLPPLKYPLSLAAGKNQPLWLTFAVPRGIQAGEYGAELKLDTTLGERRLPLVVQVYDFEMPEQTHLRSALGLGTAEINRYHRLSRAEDQRRVFEKYLKNFAEHRISPYSFYDYAPIDIRFVGAGTNRHAQIDFTKFDQAASTWLDQHHFSTFQLPLRGLGGGTFQSRHLGRLEGFEEGTPEHARLFQDYLSQVQKHLRQRGWLDHAFTYWFDEPDPKDYAFVVAGMQRIKAAAPGVRRMLTEQPEKALLGHVDIWCGLTPEWTREKVQARRAAGEEVWWYICTGPKAPYVTEFIDHPGTELRLWPWQSWQYGVEGILVWATVYWNSPAAFPTPQHQDPWADPMSYVSGYDFQPGHVGYWGNGDGRFLYPPRRGAGGDADADGGPVLDEPVNSVRWENLRDGMEDYEYFWLLRQAIGRAQARPGGGDLLREAEALLEVPPDVSRDLTHFTTDPRPLLQHRDRIARMIERLKRAGP